MTCYKIKYYNTFIFINDFESFIHVVQYQLYCYMIVIIYILLARIKSVPLYYRNEFIICDYSNRKRVIVQ